MQHFIISVAYFYLQMYNISISLYSKQKLVIKMTSREIEILEIIKKNPMISQQEIADNLGIARSSIAVHITNLMKKGYIAGKGYIISGNSYVTVIGGANIDIQGFPQNTLINRDSNPGKVRLSLGGVGRNIAENIAKLEIRTKLICPLGDDVYGKKISEDCILSGIDMSHSIVFKGANSSTYLSITDHMGDMEVAISDMDILEQLTVEIIKEKAHVIENSSCIVVDTNLTEEVLYHLLKDYKNKDFFLDTVSTSKAMKVSDFIGSFHTIKPNRLEAEKLSGMKIRDDHDLRKASEYFLKKGVKNVYISLGEEGVYYSDGEASGTFKIPSVKVISATGAGDAFMAGLVYGYLNDFKIEESTKFASAAAVLALSHENTINPMMSLEGINKIIKESM